MASACDDDRIAMLGDPSGRQDAEYWDAWFAHYQALKNKEASGPDEDYVTATIEPFEWYCFPDEVVRALSSHLRKPSSHINSDGADRRDVYPLRIIHPGSGTSLLPRKLMDQYPQFKSYHHVVVDVSPVAIEQAKQVLGNGSGAQVEFVVGDLLSDRANELFPDSRFAAWIDKGFLDAVFSSTSPDSHIQAQRLFSEALRLLCKNGGVAIVVSLAEDHSLSYIIRNGWLSSSPSNGSSNEPKNWSRTLHVHELQPTSGTMRPFAFVLTVTTAPENDESIAQDAYRVAWHRIDNNEDAAEIMEVTRDEAYSILRERIGRSRVEFAKSRQRKLVARKNRVLAVIDVKPNDPDVDLESLGRRIIETKWSSAGDRSKSLEILWQPAVPADGKTSVSHCDDVVRCFDIVSIGFGISKLRMSCVVDADELEELVPTMEEDLDEYVQSIDVDWELTVPVSDARDFLRLLEEDVAEFEQFTDAELQF